MMAEERRLEDRSGPAAFDIIAIAASAGGVTALTKLLGRLPADFGATVLIVQHVDPGTEASCRRSLAGSRACR